jgi:CubicO group peptidase (beta-lactamase class C family)
MGSSIVRISLLLGLAACSAPPEAETLQTALDRQLLANAQQYGIAGQAVLILHDGETLYRTSQGLGDREHGTAVLPEDIFPVFSVSKLFASVLVMQLVERGELDLNKPIGDYLSELPQSWQNIKVAAIFNHTSGLPEYFDAGQTPIKPPVTREAAFEALAKQPLQFATGADTRYTQTNFVVLGALLEAHYDRPYRQIVTERIVEPLGLKRSYFGKAQLPAGNVVRSYIGKDGELIAENGIDWPEYSIVHAELYTTVDDLGTFIRALRTGLLLETATLQDLWQPKRFGEGGLGWFASGWEYGTSGKYKYVGHDGSTKVRVRLLFDDSLAEDTYTCIYLTNGSATNVWSRTLIDSVMAVVAPEKFSR